MIVLKFGGTSVGSATNIKKVAQIVESYTVPITVVLSAVSGTTNTLIDIHHLLVEDNKDSSRVLINKLEASYYQLLTELYATEYHQLKALTFIRDVFDKLKKLTKHQQNEIVAQGEIISTHLFHLYLSEQYTASTLLSAFNFMSIGYRNAGTCE